MLREIQPSNKKIKLIRRYRRKSINGSIYQGDAADFLRSLKEEIANIVFIDPPFNLGKKYSRGRTNLDKKPENEYINWLKLILNESIRILAPGGALYLYHLPKYALIFGEYLQEKLLFRHWIAVSMKNGFVRGQYLYPAHYALLYFSKGRPLKFKRPKIEPEICRHCGKLIKDYGGYKKFITNGINISDIWEDLSPVRHSNRKNRFANELPIEMLERIIEISGETSSLYVDPFVGSGTGVIAATKAGMRFFACDLIIENSILTCRRLDKI
jgi:site-specific DNA-methyltransferase (adenine-specific)